MMDCDYTPEQTHVIQLAAAYGEPYGYRKTLAAIVLQESIVGRYVVKVNPSDKPYGSYGITQVKLDTAMWLLGVKSSWKAKAVIVPRLINDDLYALGLAVKKLDSVKKMSGTWLQLWKNYNGSMVYAHNIRDNIRHLERCGYFSWS